MMGRLVRIHFAPGADRNTAHLIYFGTGDEVYPNMYTIFAANGIMIAVTSQI